MNTDPHSVDPHRAAAARPAPAVSTAPAAPVRRSSSSLCARGALLLPLALLAAACEKDRAEAPAAPAPAASPVPPPPPPPAQAPPWAGRAAAPTTGATVSGTAVLTDAAALPRPVPESRGSDPFCARTPAIDESLVTGPGGALRDVLVRVTAGGGGPYAPPAEPAVFTQERCVYKPRVLAAIEGQEVLVRNADGTLHNVHALLGPRTLFNKIQLNEQAPPIRFRGEPTAGLVRLRCDVHPWMAASLWTVRNPFFAVTAADGTFTLRNLPPGDYTIEAWHERLGTQQSTLTIPAAGGAAPPPRLTFRFSLKNQLTPATSGG